MEYGTHGEHGPLASCPVGLEARNEIELAMDHSMMGKTVQPGVKEKRIFAHPVLVSILYSILYYCSDK